jgi:hypothetical protein
MFNFSGFMGSDLTKKVGDYMKKSMGVNDNPKPFPTCPMTCNIAPGSCDECGRLKKQVQQALYFVDNSAEYYDRYEVCNSLTDDEGICPTCGAPANSEDTECEYCGADFGTVKTRIKVKSKNDIPNPIMAAYQKVYERQMYIIAEKKKQNTSGGLLKGMMDSVMNMANQLNAIEKPMPLSDIESTAAAYGVPVRAYLEGLDDGRYLTASGKRASDQLQMQRQANIQREAQSRANYNAMIAQNPAPRQSSGLDFLQRHAEYTSPTKYSGGSSSSSCCGNCRFYMMQDNKCGENRYRHPDGASYYCGSYRSK